MKIVTWNLERPNASSVRKNDRVLAVLKRVDADLVILTETNCIIDPGAAYTPLASDPLPLPGQSDYKYGENRCTIWSKYPLKRVETYDSATAVCANVQTHQGPLNVYGTVIGKFGNRERSFLPDLETQIADWQRISQIGSLCVAGDFNISFKDNYYFTKEGRKKIGDCFEKLEIKNLTGQEQECIDHIAISDSFAKNVKWKVEEWNLERKDAHPRLSDHKGVSVSTILAGWDDECLLERETGIEPATFSLGRRRSIENSIHSVSRHLVLAIEITGTPLSASSTAQTEHKWSTPSNKSVDRGFPSFSCRCAGRFVALARRCS